MAKGKDEKHREEKSGEEDRQEEKSGTPQEDAPKKKKSKLLLIILLAVVLGGGGAGAYFFFGNQILDLVGLGSDEAAAKTEPAPEQKKGSSGGPILSLDPFIFNLANNNARFAKVSLALSLQNPKAFEEAKKMVPILRDRALMVLSAKSAEELIDVTKREPIKAELQKSLKDLFKEKDDLESVYITDIIIP